MIKTAIFVEGQTELIFTRELILKFFEWQNVWVECFSLFNDQDHNPVEYSYKDPNADCFFEILNIGNDNKVISSILKREEYLWNSGFDKIIGLRDMYSQSYRETVKKSTIDLAINKKFIDNHQQTLSAKSKCPERIKFHFAIMELEAWLLGIEDFFQRYHDVLDNNKINEVTNIDLSQINPETEIFHPASLINKILGIANDSYDKSKGEINKFMKRIEKQDFINLLNSGKCDSFNQYFRSLDIHYNR